jgi:hypothetical protein
MLIAGGGSVNFGYPPTLYSLIGEELFAFPETGQTGGIWHHDAIQLPDGTIMSMAESDNIDPSDGSELTGLRLEAHDPETGAVTWSWDSQSAFDDDTLPVKALHGNSVQYVDDADGPAVWVSAKLIDMVFRIDWNTGAVTDRVGVTGDYTLLDPVGRVLGDEHWFYGQHAAEIDGDRLLLYDNAERGPTDDPQSRILELELDGSARTARIVWEWTEPGWLEQNWGDADRLADDHLLLGIGHCWSCDSVGTGLSRVIELDDRGVEHWRLTFTGEKDALYRSDRYDGCEMFSNRRYCPSL